MLLTSRSRINIITRASADKKENPISIARKAYEAKRTVTAKENLNKLLMIASSDIKELNEFIKDLDDIHKKEMTEIVTKIQGKKKDEIVEDENIFKDEK